MNIDYDFYNLVLSEIATRIASDQIIIENEINNIRLKGKSNKLKNIIRRNRVNILLLNEFVSVGRQISDSPVGTSNLLDAINIAEEAFAGARVNFDKNRTKPLIAVIGDKKITASLLKILLALIILEDNSLKKINLSIRRRGDYVTLKAIGGRIINDDLFLKDSGALACSLFGLYGAKIRFSKKNDNRLLFLRMHLSNQMPLLYNN